MPNNNSDTYLTISSSVESLFTEKRSKFLAFAYQVSNIEQVNSILAENRKNFYNARHICFAYRLGVNGEEWRMNDDGEPSGTAGRPIYGQILRYKLTNILVVVVRYFGGVKLGTGGLAVAYKSAAENVLLAANIVEKKVERFVRVFFNYPLMNDIMRIIKDNNFSVVSQTAGESLSDNSESKEEDRISDCAITVRVSLSEIDSFTNRLDLINETNRNEIVVTYCIYD
ncbi:MAG TPA: YigZ family protein [Bacteroidaceae bacterium]|nr:YigZ family protein [Bacteroidaceae bacterium]